MERRSYDAKELRADSDTGVLVGHAAVFNVLSHEMFGFREQVAPGAFRESLADDDIRALWAHDTAKPLGRKSAGTLRLIEDDIGLRAEIDVPDTSVGRDALTSITRGDVSHMSFGFDVLEDAWKFDEEPAIRTLSRVKLWEVSPVVFPAYPQTDIDARDYEGAVESMQRAIDAAKPKFRPRLMAARKRMLELMERA